MKKVNIPRPPRRKLFITHSLMQFFAVVTVSVVFSLAANLSLSNVLLASAISSLFFLIFGGPSIPLTLSAGFAFLPSLILATRTTETLEVGSSTWQFQMGGIVVALWIVGLLYILMASLIRFIGVKRLRGFFSFGLAGSLSVTLAIVILPRVVLFSVLEPMAAVPQDAWKYIALAATSFIVYLVSVSLFKSRANQASWSLLLGLFGGYLLAIILDAVELLWLSKSLDATLIFKTFGDGGIFSSGPLVIFQNTERYFGFWQYLHFDAQSLLLLIPMALLSLSLHLANLTTYAERKDESMSTPHADRTILGEGLGILTGGIMAGYPVTIGLETVDIAIDKKEFNSWSYVPFMILAIIMSILVPFSSWAESIPMPIIGGLLVGTLSLSAVRGFALLTRKVHGEINPQWLALAGFTISLGVVLGFFELLGELIGSHQYAIVIYGVTIPSISIVVVASFIFNLIFPKIVD